MTCTTYVRKDGCNSFHETLKRVLVLMILQKVFKLKEKRKKCEDVFASVSMHILT